MQHFKDVELAKVQMEEKASFHKELDRLKQELQRTYEMKAKALMDRERNAIDQLQKQQEVQIPFHSAWLHFRILFQVLKVLFSFPVLRLKKKTCICSDSRSWKKLTDHGREKMSWRSEWRLLKGEYFLISLFLLWPLSQWQCCWLILW